MNNTKSVKYGLAPKQIETKSEELWEKNFFHRLGKVKQDAAREQYFYGLKDIRQNNKLREPLDLGKLVYVLTEEEKHSSILYKSSTEHKNIL